MQFVLRVTLAGRRRVLIATLLGSEREAEPAWAAATAPGVYVLLGGDRPFAGHIEPSLAADALAGRVTRSVIVEFPGRSPVRRRLQKLRVVAAPATPGLETVARAPAAALRLTPEAGAPLYLHPDGRLSVRPDGVDTGAAASAALVTAARWVSSRRTTSFERLFPSSAFHPDQPERPERLSVAQGEGLLAWVSEALDAAPPAPTAPDHGRADAQLRSGALTVLSHLIATSLRDPAFHDLAGRATARIFRLIAAENGPGSFPALRAHALQLLQLRGPALSAADADKVRSLARASLRSAPPYAELTGAWRFACCSDHEFHEGECDILLQRGFVELAAVERGFYHYRVFEAPFRNAHGGAIEIHARSATPSNENEEMGDPSFVGLLINRHAQLGVYDMRASATRVRQQGYKLMMNSQCAGLTTRYQISRLFPDADIYSSWDSTYFRTGPDHKVTQSEGMDCFLAVLQGMAAKETHAQISARILKAQWYHEAGSSPDFVQFVGPAHAAVVARFSDVNNDGKADLYDGFLDLELTAIAEDLTSGSTPRATGLEASQISGEAAVGLDWAAGSLNRVAQYSDLWDGLPGAAEVLHPFTAGGFFDAGTPPVDVPGARAGEDLGRLPAVCRYHVGAKFSAEILFHAHLAHAPKELKRLLALAEAITRAFEAGVLPARGALATPLGQRGMVLLGMAGLLDFPADQNQIDALWSRALKMSGLPPISRSTVRACINDADHDASNYYGSLRGLIELVGKGGDKSGDRPGDKGRLGASDPVLWAQLGSGEPQAGRAGPLG